MHKPIAVFDSGIGSYAIVAEIQKRLPRQDIIYFADRANFPYGGKQREQLIDIMRKTITFLQKYDPHAIVVASNAPSILVLEDVKPYSSVPMFGVFPPIGAALAASASGKVGIMGVRSLIESDALRLFVQHYAAEPENVTLINASSMVELVETGSFLFSPVETQAAVSAFVEDIFDKSPLIDVLTLSSTHLPWLRSFFEIARPNCLFLDPVERTLSEIGEGTVGTGRIQGLVTEAENYGQETFRRMLGKIGVEIPIELVDRQ